MKSFVKSFIQSRFVVLVPLVLGLCVLGGLAVTSVRNARAEEKRFCGFVTRLAGQLNSERWVAIVNNGMLIVQVPTPQAYSRLKVGEQYTFVYRRDDLIAIADGNLCAK